MEPERSARRTASQSSLRHEYNGHAPAAIRHSNTSQGLSRPSFHRTPLQAVGNTSANILRSPGPLESMLKTTTETGDLGMFTIGASATPKPSTPSKSHPRRPRHVYPEVRSAQFTRSARSLRNYYRDHSQDDRMRLPSSYRDTTSEIFSLYGSEAHQSRVFTPSNDDSQRSHSLTTYDSRHIPSQKSSATLQSVSSTSGLQRPRSPFPYPARLRRPDVRPASPAVTDNGSIDYSRRVWLDRSHQRPVHGGYRPAHTYSSRHALLIPMHSEASRSTTSLPSRAPPGPSAMSPPPYRGRTPTSHRSRTPRSSETYRYVPHEQGVRSPSLTSIVEMYQRPATSLSNRTALPSSRSFYYDYSEEFEHEPPSPSEPEIPLCPIPQRAASLSRPMVLRAEEKGNVDFIGNEKDGHGRTVDTIGPIPEELSTADAALAQGPHDEPYIDTATERADVLIYETRGSPQPDHEPELIGTDERKSKVGVQDASEGCGDSLRPMLAPTQTTDRKDGPVAVVDAVTRSASACQARNRLCSLDSPSPSTSLLLPAKRCRRSKTIGPHGDYTNDSADKRASNLRLRKLSSALDPGLTDLASFVTSFDRLARSRLSKKGDDGASSEDTELLILDPDRLQTGYPPYEDTDNGFVVLSPTQQSSEVSEKRGRPFFKRHRRNPAATRISTTNISRPEDKTDTPSTREKPFELLSPQLPPPLHQLRVKKSAPQLMKALPPLPIEEEIQDDSSGCAQKVEACFAEAGHRTSIMDKHPMPCSNSPAKLKVRMKPLPSTPELQDAGSVTIEGICPSVVDSTGSPPPKKLRIKVSRNPVAAIAAGKDGTVLRSPALKQWNSLADLEHCARKDMFTSKNRLHDTFSDPAPGSTTDGYKPVTAHDSQQTAGKGRKYVENFEAGRSEESSNSRQSFRRSRSMIGKEIAEHNGLRQKLSYLRLRLEATDGSRGIKQEDTLFPFGVRGASGEIQTPTPEGELKTHQPRIALLRPGKTKRRVRRWARGAKNAMRRAMKKTLDRSTDISA